MFDVEALAAAHDRAPFVSGSEPLDRYFRGQVGQDVRRRLCNCFVFLNERRQIGGYYTFAAANLPLTDMPLELSARLPRYGFAPAALIGRLAVDHRFRRQSLGAAMVMDAVRRATSAEPAVFALVVDAKDQDAAGFYRNLGFTPYLTRPQSLFLPIVTALKSMRGPGL